MSSMNTSAQSTMNAKTTTDSTAKKVVKKVTAAAAAAAPSAVAAAAPADAAVAKKAVKRSTSTTSSVVTASNAVSSSAAASPAAETSEASADAVSTLADEVAALQTQLVALRDGASAALATLKRVAKRATQEVKDARKNRRRTRAETADGEPRKPSNFEIPVPISDELSIFLGGGKAASMSRAQVTKAINAYVNERKLRTKHDITPDAALRKLLNVDESIKLTIFNMQTYLGRHYIKPAAKASA